jgi:FGGY-family pentulose kinase
MTCTLGIDIGTGSARAGLFDASGGMLGSAAEPTRLWRPRSGWAQHSSADLWRAVGVAVRGALEQTGVEPSQVKGVGVDATCSLVVVDREGRGLSVDPDGADAQDVIVWMDHRAQSEAEQINAGGHEVLKYVGGVISPEMQTPKLLWLKRHMPELWERAGHFFDLADWLTWRMTGSTTRSLCTTVCKWTYLAHAARDAGDEAAGWQGDYFRGIGLGDLADEGFARIGTNVRPMGEPVGEGVTADAAEQLGLTAGTAVGVGIIDAHAGGLGVLGGDRHDQRVALIGGTSSCHMAVSQQPRFVPGVWGPYLSAMVPGKWLSEGGQSASGALVDRIVFGHAASGELKQQAEAAGVSAYAWLNQRLGELAGGGAVDELTAGLHVDADFHGNRSPRADPTLRGTISGLRLEQGLDELALLYLATVQAVAYGTRHILDSLDDQGYTIDTIAMTGGGTKNPLFIQQHANATGRRVELPAEPEAVLLGSAMLGAVAAGTQPSVTAAMSAMSRAERVIKPQRATRDYHSRKYQVHQRMHEDQLAYRGLMDGRG